MVRRDFSTLARLETRPGSKFAVVVSDDEGTLIKGCELIVQAENNTFNSGTTGDDGIAVFNLKVRGPSTLLADVR